MDEKAVEAVAGARFFKNTETAHMLIILGTRAFRVLCSFKTKLNRQKGFKSPNKNFSVRIMGPLCV